MVRPTGKGLNPEFNSLSAEEWSQLFDPLGWLADAVSGNVVEFAKLKEGKTTVYLVIPQDKIATHGTWLGLVTRQAITAVARS